MNIKNSLNSILDSVIYYTGFIALGIIFLEFVFYLNEL